MQMFLDCTRVKECQRFIHNNRSPTPRVADPPSAAGKRREISNVWRWSNCVELQRRRAANANVGLPKQHALRNGLKRRIQTDKSKREIPENARSTLLVKNSEFEKVQKQVGLKRSSFGTLQLILREEFYIFLHAINLSLVKRSPPKTSTLQKMLRISQE